MRRARGPIGPLVACAAAAIVILGLLVARNILDVVEVRGRSMLPSLRPGDRLVVVRHRGPIRAGAVVLAPDPREPRRELVKRVASADDDHVILAGDNVAESTDARTFGAVPAVSVSWRAVARYWPPRRIGLVR